MNYEQTLKFLFEQLPMYQRQGKSAYKKDLSNTIALCSLLNHPEQKFKSIHIAGTNGKGSTAHMLASIFREAEYKTGLYTSPHLKDFRERIRVNGQMISETQVIDFVQNYFTKFATISPSFFEWTVALAFYHFAKEKVDIAIIETGLGGRLDSTNVINPELSIITNIGLDHTDMLGDTLDLIACEKAGIIKEATPVVIVNDSGQKLIFDQKAKEKQSPIYYAKQLATNLPLSTDLLGNYQKENICGVFQAFLVLRKLGWDISIPNLEAGLQKVKKNTGLRGRWEILTNDPLTIAETAHNKEGIELALEQLIALNKKTVHFVIGFVKDKKLKEILALFPKEAHYYFCKAKIPRALDERLLLLEAKKAGLSGNCFPSVKLALKQARREASFEDIIYIGGSNFVVAEAI